MLSERMKTALAASAASNENRKRRLNGTGTNFHGTTYEQGGVSDECSLAVPVLAVSYTVAVITAR